MGRVCVAWCVRMCCVSACAVLACVVLFAKLSLFLRVYFAHPGAHIHLHHHSTCTHYTHAHLHYARASQYTSTSQHTHRHRSIDMCISAHASAKTGNRRCSVVQQSVHSGALWRCLVSSSGVCCGAVCCGMVCCVTVCFGHDGM